MLLSGYLKQRELIPVATCSNFGQNRNSANVFCRNRNQAETKFLSSFGRSTVTEIEFRSVSSYLLQLDIVLKFCVQEGNCDLYCVFQGGCLQGNCAQCGLNPAYAVLCVFVFFITDILNIDILLITHGENLIWKVVAVGQYSQRFLCDHFHNAELSLLTSINSWTSGLPNTCELLTIFCWCCQLLNLLVHWKHMHTFTWTTCAELQNMFFSDFSLLWPCVHAKFWNISLVK